MDEALRKKIEAAAAIVPTLGDFATAVLKLRQVADSGRSQPLTPKDAKGLLFGLSVLKDGSE